MHFDGVHISVSNTNEVVAGYFDFKVILHSDVECNDWSDYAKMLFFFLKKKNIYLISTKKK